MLTAGRPVAIETIARPGYTVAQMKALVDADMAAWASDPVQSVLFNLGANEMGILPAQATWEANLAYILDAFHAKWPAVKVYLMRPWRRGYAADANTLATWINNVVTARAAWAFNGPDERVFLENGDDGVTYTSDGVHPNAAGYALTATQWQTALGY